MRSANATQAKNFTMSDSDDDWFNKDEDELVQNLQQQVKQQVAIETHEERIDFCSRAGKRIICGFLL